MIDIIAALVFGVMFTIDVVVLVGLAPVRVNTKLLKAFAIAGGWAVTVITIAAMGGFSPGIGRLPAPVLAFSLLVITGLIGWYFVRGFRNALVSLPLAALIGVNGFRITGGFFSFCLRKIGCPLPSAPLLVGATSSQVLRQFRLPRWQLTENGCRVGFSLSGIRWCS